ncbi:hypothetical protein [Parvibaculum sp.]|uniref:hypothetical protein n=1 Tax=Parvibaculum sp. TaxID=2024848 RepID=UPI0027353E67|nr:hypothetical protein [Parvibaculum sp.]MDP3328741.1 hypothetical protein [Parvibaculum sp.]
MSALSEAVAPLLKRMPEDTRRKLIGAAYSEIVGYDPLADDVTMSLEEGEESLLGIIEEYVAQGAKDEVFRGVARAVTVVDESPNRNIAGMALASALVNRELADVKTSVYQRIMRDLVRAGIDITKITVMKIANDDTIEYSLSDLVDVMTD